MMKKLAAGAATTVLAMAAFGGAAFAQETTSGINGTVRTAAGGPLANAQVTVVYEPTNQTFTSTTDSGGLFSIRQLPPGGPYRVTASGTGGEASSEVPSIGLGAPYDLNLSVGGGVDNTAVSEVTVTASRAAVRQVQTGPRSSFNATDLETLPSFSRDFKDIARLNPFVTLDPSNGNGLIIAGNNYRNNAIYIDGVRQTDDFGLGTNGYPTLRAPLSFDLVQSLNVEVAPYDVSYGTFTGGVLNIATKSGSNEIHGTAYYEYDSDHLGYGRLIRDHVVPQRFQDKTYGVTIGGPIIPDRLFFEFGYEKYEGLGGTSYGASDSTGVANTVPGTTVAQVSAIQTALQSRYGIAAGDVGLTVPLEDEKYFGKMTLQLTSKHRLVFEAQTDDGNQFTNTSSNTALNLSSNTYGLDIPLTSYSGYIYSNWTSDFSTELSYTDRTEARIAAPTLAGTPEYDIYPNGGGTTTVAGTTTNPAIVAGTNYSYQANELTTESKLFRARANYTWGAHTFLAGYEHEDRTASDLFIQNANASFYFTSVANLQAGDAYRISYSNAADNNTADGVVPLSYTIHTAYLQDEYRPFSNLTLRFGLRDEYYEQGDKPLANTFLRTTFGIDNTKNIDGLNVLMPRVGFNYRPFSGLVITGGFGRFSGGSPDVYINNAFNGSGNILGSVSCTRGQATPTSTCPFTTAQIASLLTGVNGTIPAAILQANTASANAGTGYTTSIADNFKPASVYKTSLSAVYTANFADWAWTGVAGRYIGNDWRLHGDYIYQWTDEGLLLQDLDTLNSVVGTVPDGRPIFSTTRATGNRYDLLLTNTDKGESNVYAVGLGKTFDWGLDFDVTYTHTRATDVVPFTSSVSSSNYRTNAFTDPNNPDAAVTSYSIPNEVKVQLGYSHAFFGDYSTRLRIFGQRRSGLPYSYTYQVGFGPSYDSSGFGLSSALFSTGYPDELIYVPKTDSSGNVTATSDPKVAYAFSNATSGSTVAGIGAQNLAGFNDFLKATGLIKYAGSVAPRNAFNSRDVTTIDLQFTQEIPAFFPTHAKAELYLDIFNLGNMINNSWGVDDQYNFPYEYQAIQATIRPCSTPGAGCAPGQANQYLYSGYGQSATRLPTTITSTSGPPPSQWALKLGVRYKF